MSAPERPPEPEVGKITHHSIELKWAEALTACQNGRKGDGRVRVTVQEEEKTGGWGNVYTGYAKVHIMEGLEPWSQYKYRVRFMNQHGNSEWSPAITVTTAKEPLTGDHIHRAIITEDLKGLERVLNSGEVNVDTPDKYGFSPLMQVAQKGFIEMLELLVSKGADVNYQNDAGKTPLMLAAYSGKLNSVKELRHHGAKYEIGDKGGSTALHWAMDGRNLELIEWMIDDGADINVTDSNGWTPLLRVAAVGGDSNCANLLLRNQAKINHRDKDGKTSLMIAVVNGHQGLVELLLEKGADLTIQNEYGKTGYEMALAMERRRITRVLEEHMDKKGIKYHH